MNATDDEPTIVSVWSSYGHTFMTDDREYDDDGRTIGYQVSCLTCGAEYVLRPTPDARNDGAYMASNGDDPRECTHDTSMEHGDRHDTGHELDCPDGCEHCTHDCNCVRCTS